MSTEEQQTARKENSMTPGTLGHMYENRKSKKIGVLESRNEKFKTLMMRGEDGNSFTVNYSTFKSNWRKYQGDDVIQTSTQVEDSRNEEKREKEVADKELKKKPTKAKLDKTEYFKKVNAVQKIVTGTVSDNNDRLIVKILSKGGIAAKKGNQKIFEIWVHSDGETCGICVREDLWREVELSPSNVDLIDSVVFKDNWRVQYLCEGVSLDRVESIVTDLAESSNKLYEDTEEE